MELNILNSALIGSGVISGFVGIVILKLRRVVPTNMVNIVQSRKKTISYGKGKEAGNTYYQWPVWLPFLGVTVTEFPESIFQVTLKDYNAYDKDRLPFVVDVVAFFRVDSADTVAQRVASFNELNQQLVAVLQGSVRKILATNKLEEIMQERAILGEQFTKEVKEQIAEWGVLPVKSIEFMDLKDAAGSTVIANIMSKEESRIQKESRVVIAANMQDAELKEIEAKRIVDIQRQDAEQQVGTRTAEKDREVGIAKQISEQEILKQNRLTTETQMEVQKVQSVKQAEIDKEVTIVEANKNKEQMQIEAGARLEVAKLNAQGITAEGEARAKAEQAMLQAPVNAQITLAKEIGNNSPYQEYLVKIETIKASIDIGVKMAEALGNSDLKVIANGGDIQSGVNNLLDLFSTKGGTHLSGMLTAFGQTEIGQQLIEKFIKSNNTNNENNSKLVNAE